MALTVGASAVSLVPSGGIGAGAARRDFEVYVIVGVGGDEGPGPGRRGEGVVIQRSAFNRPRIIDFIIGAADQRGGELDRRVFVTVRNSGDGNCRGGGVGSDDRITRKVGVGVVGYFKCRGGGRINKTVNLYGIVGVIREPEVRLGKVRPASRKTHDWPPMVRRKPPFSSTSSLRSPLFMETRTRPPE